MIWLTCQRKWEKSGHCEKSVLFTENITKGNSQGTFALSVQISQGYVVRNTSKNTTNKHYLCGLSMCKNVNKALRFERYIIKLFLLGYSNVDIMV